MNMEELAALLAAYDDRVVVIVNSTVIIGNSGEITSTNETSPGA